MRQAGMLAAAALYALDHHVERLAQDHVLAKYLGDELARIEGLTVDPVHSNIVFVDVQEPLKAKAAGLIAHLQAHNILATGLYRLRFVTHLDVDAAGVERAAAVIRDYF